MLKKCIYGNDRVTSYRDRVAILLW